LENVTVEIPIQAVVELLSSHKLDHVRGYVSEKCKKKKKKRKKTTAHQMKLFSAY
jgi:hypothetical protein